MGKRNVLSIIGMIILGLALLSVMFLPVGRMVVESGGEKIITRYSNPAMIFGGYARVKSSDSTGDELLKFTMNFNGVPFIAVSLMFITLCLLFSGLLSMDPNPAIYAIGGVCAVLGAIFLLASKQSTMAASGVKFSYYDESKEYFHLGGGTIIAALLSAVAGILSFAACREEGYEGY